VIDHHQRPAEPRRDVARLTPLPSVEPPPTRRRSAQLALAILGLALLAGLGLWYAVRPLERLDGGRLRPGQAAPGFTLTDLAGRQVTLSDYRGRPVVINFWATWCVPCRKEMPDLEAAARRHREHGLVVLAVNVHEGPALVKPFMDDLGLREIVPLLDTNATAVARYQVVGLPTTYFIDRQGQIRDIHMGPLDAASIAQKLARIM
jgi:thiol-disulfide isomerase/thioredoxin